jgi:hypothetical protein
MASTSAKETTTGGSGPARRSGVSRAGRRSPSAPCSSPADAGGRVADGLLERELDGGAYALHLPRWTTAALAPGERASRRAGAAGRVPEPPPPPLEPPDPLEPDDEPEPDEQPDWPVPPEREPLPV